MINRKLCIVACCASVIWGPLASAQPVNPGSADQSQALDALRQAEANPSGGQPAPVNKKSKRKAGSQPMPAAAPD
ncbi:MAG TPA: hypothetical protein VFC44_10590, partial [Candidatus Saccharimonadales bacterium]|nr:hypothetical protein [Candidatus Saccharimonadales bacterium]